MAPALHRRRAAPFQRQPVRRAHDDHHGRRTPPHGETTAQGSSKSRNQLQLHAMPRTRLATRLRQLAVQPPELLEALEIKASALRIIEAKGTPMRVSEVDIIHAKWKGLDILYTPTRPEDKSNVIDLTERCRLVVIPPITSQLLDISQGPKVFSIRWNEGGLVEIVRPRRGDWESLLSH